MASTESEVGLSLSPEELKAKYLAERDKRLRSDGNNQYIEFKGVYADFDKDPYVEPGFTRDPIIEETDVIIVGGGLGGMMASVRLAQQGIRDVRIIEKGGDFGGTWYWNRYPGAACDVESYIYLPFLEETGYIPTEKYAKAPEIFEHCQRIANHFDLYPLALFQTEIKEIRWNDASSRWDVTTDRGDKISARFTIIAGGVLHKAKLPGIKGIETFKGHSFHTSRWDYNYTGGSPTTPMDKLADKRVAIIGTGATAIQAVPKVGEAARQLYVFQRTPSGVGERGNQPTDLNWAKTLEPGWHQERMDNFTTVVSGYPADRDMVADGWTEIFQGNIGIKPGGEQPSDEERQMADYIAMEKIRARIDSVVTDRETAEALKPWYNRMCKRPCFHDEYLPAFNRPNVKLVDTDGHGVDEIREHSIVVKGVEYPVDCIIYASGFEVSTEYVRRLGFQIYGHDGVSISEAWAQGPATLHGMFARGFPNLLMYSPTQGGWAINFAHMLGELAIHSAWVIKYCLSHGIVSIEPSEEAQEAWWQVILKHIMFNAQFLSECTPSYLNGEGKKDMSMVKLATFNGGTIEYINILRAWREKGDMPGLEKQREEVSA